VGRPDNQVDAGAGALPRFARDLRQLRRGGGRPTYRTLAGRTHYPALSLAEAAAGTRLPTLEVTLAYVDACGGDVDEWRGRWQTLAEAREAGVDIGPPAASAGSVDPTAAAAGAARVRPPRRYWRYPAAALVLLAVAAANFSLGRHSAYESVRAAADARAVAGAAAAQNTSPQLRYGFEDPVSPWTPAWNAANLTAGVTTGLADTGRRSLRLQATPDAAAPPAMGTAATDLRPGATVTVRLYDAGGSGTVRPYVQDTDGGIHWPSMSPPTLRRGTWTTCSWQVPQVQVQRVGLELDSAGTAGLVIALDTVEW
jgi:hypothetical protein